jgi:two-component system cell cycle response regulator
MPSTNVLIVESDSECLALEGKVLRDEGYVLHTARTREQALQMLSTQEIHIVLLSTDLQPVDGYELARTIRKAQKEKSFQLLLLASSQQGEEMRQSVDAGSDDFIHKPFDQDELRARMRAAQNRWQNQANLVREREFYRIAVAEEERLSSLVLDQNQNLKDAYDKIRRLNAELEKANRELEQIAAYDSLSGLLNRRSLFTRISIEIERSLRLDVPLTGLMIDIDRFKSINDNYGHQCGDTVLHEIGGRLQAGLRKYDYAGRYGGEEFFVVLSNSTEQQAFGIGERFRKDMEDSQFSCSGESFTITVSIGVARYAPGESQESWIERADRAMYQAKQAGRNKILSSSP